MLRRTPFKRAIYVPAPSPPATRSTRAGVIELVTADLRPVPKGPEPVRPGKRTPTVEERLWMEAIVRYGCIACRIDGILPRPTAVHHIVQGGRRLGHLFTLGLCDPGHHQNGAQLGMVSRHPWKARFENRYGLELDLLQRLRGEIGVSK